MSSARPARSKKEHLSRKISPEVGAAFLHHRFTQIHPFQDGNGRVARALASLIFIKAEDFPIVVLDSERGTYIDSLEAADQGQLQPLIDFMAEKQKDLLYKATKEAQYLDFDETLTSIKESKAKYLGRLQKYRENFEKANLHISAWYDAAQEILNHYKGAVKDLPDLKTRTEEPFTWVE